MSTAGPSSQVAYEATAVLLLSCSTAAQVSLTKDVIGDTKTVGGKPEEMDIGPVPPDPLNAPLEKLCWETSDVWKFR